jgi:hypothetical protein
LRDATTTTAAARRRHPATNATHGTSRRGRFPRTAGARPRSVACPPAARLRAWREVCYIGMEFWRGGSTCGRCARVRS